MNELLCFFLFSGFVGLHVCFHVEGGDTWSVHKEPTRIKVIDLDGRDPLRDSVVGVSSSTFFA